MSEDYSPKDWSWTNFALSGFLGFCGGALLLISLAWFLSVSEKWAHASACSKACNNKVAQSSVDECTCVNGNMIWRVVKPKESR